MMKKVSIMLWAAFTLAACARDAAEEFGAEPQLGGGPRLTVRACTGGEDTRISTADGLNFTLVAGQEQIGLYLCEPALEWTQENVLFTAEGTDERGWLTFATEQVLPVGLQSSTKVLAYAPYRKTQWQVSGSTGDGSVEETRADAWDGMRVFDLPSVQTQKQGGDATSLADYYALAAYPTEPTSRGNGAYSVDLHFAGVFSVVRFNVRNNAPGASALTVKRLTLTVDNSPLTGLFRTDLNQNPSLTDDAYAVEPVAGETERSVTVQLTEPVQLAAGQETSIYAVVRAGEVVNPVIRVYAEQQSGEEVMFERRIEKTVALSRKSRTQFGITLENPWLASVKEPFYLLGNKAWLIQTDSELAWVAEQVNSGARTFEGENFRLAADIDLSGRKWTPIGRVSDDPNESRSFAGTLDFNGYTVYNLYVEDFSSNNSSAGFFGNLAGVVKNGRFCNAIVQSRHYAGVIAGYSSSENMVIDYCYVQGDIVVSTEPEWVDGAYANGCMAGGIIGYCGGGKIVNCTVSGNDESYIKAYCDLGGIAGGCGPVTIENNSIYYALLLQSNKNGYKSEEITTVGAFVGNDAGATLLNNQDHGSFIIMGQ